MKYYIQNGNTKSVKSYSNDSQAVQSFLKNLIKNEEAIISPLTFLSKVGFMQDLTEANMSKEIDEIRVFRTSKVYEAMGMKKLANLLRELEKTMPSDAQKLVKMI